MLVSFSIRTSAATAYAQNVLKIFLPNILP